MGSAPSVRREAAARAPGGLPKRKPSLKKLWPQIWALVAPRKGCCWPEWD
jgi:hypothetical protein